MDNLDTIPEAIRDAIARPRGQFIGVTLARPCKVRKGQESLIKETRFTARFGVDYSNLSPIKERTDETGEGPGPLPWGEWAVFPWIITHKGDLYVRFTLVPGRVPTVRFCTQTGEEVDRDVAKARCLASEFPKREEAPLVITCKVANIMTVRAGG